MSQMSVFIANVDCALGVGINFFFVENNCHASILYFYHFECVKLKLYLVLSYI